ncbi:hypothetical protein PUN28_004565 [Cardiocondyla obscurior]|uniref:Uncharacterized protein n=1 Tax=Cardiocondyla obscurior TaxID=286306 RepID=A0AAW2GE20_9HYME
MCVCVLRRQKGKKKEEKKKKEKDRTRYVIARETRREEKYKFLHETTRHATRITACFLINFFCSPDTLQNHNPIINAHTRYTKILSVTHDRISAESHLYMCV